MILTLGWSENCGLVVCRKIDRSSYQNVNQQVAPSLKVSSYGKTVSWALSVLLTVDWPSGAGPSLLWTRNSALSCSSLQNGSEYLILSSLRVIGIRVMFVLLRRNSACFVVRILDSEALVFQSPALLLSISRWILGQWGAVEDCPAERSPPSFGSACWNCLEGCLG